MAESISHDQNFKNQILDYPEQAIRFYAAEETPALQSLITLESDPDKQAKYADWVDIYTQLDDNEINEYAKRYPEEENTMVGFAQRYREEGISIGEARGEVKGEAQTLLKLVKLKFGECPDWVESKLNTADRAQLDQWVAGILTANTLEELFTDS